MFEQLVSPGQKQLAVAVAANGGVKALRNNDKMLLALEKMACNGPSASSAEGHRAAYVKTGDTNQSAEDLRTEIFEDPDAAVEKNQSVFFRKFEAQKRQIIEELTLVVKRESDRVIQEIKGGPHERIRDRVRVFTLCKDVYSSIGVLFRQFTRFGPKWYLYITSFV
jgi:hypothetical protein